MLWIPDQKYKSMMTYSLTKTVLISISMLFYRKVHILGSFQNIKMARTAICNLILGKMFF